MNDKIIESSLMMSKILESTLNMANMELEKVEEGELKLLPGKILKYISYYLRIMGFRRDFDSVFVRHYSDRTWVCSCNYEISLESGGCIHVRALRYAIEEQERERGILLLDGSNKELVEILRGL